MSLLTLNAYAKVNLTLEVLGRRGDGYHDIISILQTVDLCDTLTFEPADDLTLECEVASLQTPENLVMGAAYALQRSTGTSHGARIKLEKAIPVAAGLGGGSSDAAAALMGLNRLWGLGLSVEDLTRLAVELGSDVPFFLHGGTAMVLGRGEDVRPLPPADLEWMVVLTPPLSMDGKTGKMFGRLTQSNFTKGALTRKLQARIRGGGGVPPQFLFNAFDDVASEAFPGLDTYWKTFESLGAREIHLAGAGPSLFAPVSRKEMGTALSLMLTHRFGWEAHLVSTTRASDREPA